MQKIKALLTRRWVLSGLGLLALALLIWLLGPLIAIAGHEPLASPAARLVVILVLVVLWTLNLLRLALRAQRSNRRIMEGIAEEAGGAAAPGGGRAEADAEVAALQARFDEALGVLRSSRDRKARNLYELPWYIIIGPPGSGKTTALVNSGLEFPLAERFGRGALRGVGGTRDCDWFFTNEAVLLDTAGRYVTHDSQREVDSAGWLGFLGLLKKHRRRRPVNGVLVAMSVADLMTLDERGREAHVQAIKQRLQELHEQLRIRFPVYVVFTKLDLVPGFVEFFDDLDRADREQVWGMTFPLDTEREGVVGRFPGELQLLLQRLDDRLMARLAAERDVQRRRKILAFPQQMAALGPLLEGFLKALFRPSRFEEMPMLRGVYFTSGTQEGTPIDRMMSALARNFGVSPGALPMFSGQGRSYFITDMLQEVAFPEASLAGTERKLERQRAWLQRGAYAATLLVAGLAIGGWAASFLGNQRFINDVGAAAQAYEQTAAAVGEGPADLLGVLPRLDAARALMESALPGEGGPGLLMGLGLYQGDKLGGAAEEAYHRELNELLAPRLAARLAEVLAGAYDDPDLQYETLKAYLMMALPERLEPDFLALWARLDWQARHGGRPGVQERLVTHLDSLLAAGLDPVEVDERLVRQVRQSLVDASPAKLVYGRLKRDHAAEAGGALRLADLLGASGEAAFAHDRGPAAEVTVPRLFTYQGYYTGFLPMSERLAERVRAEDWVLGLGEDRISSAELEGLERRLRELYYGEYVRRWDGLVQGLQVTSFQSLGHAIETLNLLSGPGSPLRAVLEGVERHTRLTRLPGGAAAGAAAGATAEAAADTRLGRLLGRAQGGMSAASVPGEEVERHFARLHALVAAGTGGAPLDRLLDLLAEVHDQLKGMAMGTGSGALSVAARSTGGDPIARLEAEAARQPQPVRRWLEGLAAASRAVTTDNARAQLDATWQASVLPSCRRALHNRYPVDRGARQDVTLADLARLFGPGGLINEFFSQNLQVFADTTTRPWSWRRGAGEQLGIPAGVLVQFQRAAAIRNAFFQASPQPKTRFSLKPVSLDPEIRQFTLDIDGQQFTYRHGPVRVQNAEWPGPQGSSATRVIFQFQDGVQHTLSEEGPWSWFRVLDAAEVERLAPDHLVVTFEAEGRRAVYELRASSVENPFGLEELSRFRCPSGL